MKKQYFFSLLVVSLLLLGTFSVVLYGKGYRLNLDRGKPDFSGTGLLVVSSDPDGAQVFINDHLTTATDNTINLSPATYEVKIFKEGYFPWKKKIKIQKEVVAKAEALLLPTAPNLENITASGVENPVMDPSMTKIAYTVSSQTNKKNGVYILDMTARPVLTLQSASTQIANDTTDVFSKAVLTWSPDGKELLATTSSSLNNETVYLLSASGFNESPKDITTTVEFVKSSWEKEKLEKETSRLNTLKQPLRKMIMENFNVLSWSLDETKILYTASISANLPIIVKPRLIGVDSTPEERSIKEGSLYVYDIKEDKNYVLTEDGKSKLVWLPDSKHLINIEDKKINILEYDGTNSTTIYAGPFIDNYVFPWPNGSKTVILTNLNNPNIPANLYGIGLK